MKFNNLNFEQSGYNSSEFLAFARSFKSQLKKELQKAGAELDKFNTGHFYLSGFFTKNGKFYYFSWHNGDSSMMYRTAKDNKDFTGGSNQWVKLNEELGNKLFLN